MILFLDFDGVLHPSAAYKTKGGLLLKATDHALFEHEDLLRSVMRVRPEVRIVLSTSWVVLHGFSDTREFLHEDIQKIVKGSTWHSSMNRNQWDAMSRYEQIALYVARHNLKDWVAIDDDIVGWPDEQQHHLVATDGWSGLGEQRVVEDLLEKLRG
jgi:hypothetical protein